MKTELRAYSIRIFSLGFLAICGQTIFIRELLGLFSGSEFTLGLLLSFWLAWTAAGALATGRFSRKHDPDMLLRITAAVCCLLLPATVLAIRFGRGLISVPPGELPSYSKAVAFSILTIAPFGLSYGALYNAASRILGRSVALTGSIVRVYILEAAGALVGGVVFYMLLRTPVTQFECSLIMSVAGAAIAIPTIRNAAKILPAAAALVIIVFITGIAEKADRWGVERIFPAYGIERFESTEYGELVLARTGDVRTWFSGGGRLFSVPEPERAEESVHIPLLSHHAPEKVLMIGGTLGGIAEEVMKHPSVNLLHCVETDGRLIELSGREPGRVYQSGQGRRTIYFAEDGRRFISGDGISYDLIIVCSPTPLNLRLNRLFTTRFLRAASGRLRDGGILAVSHSSSENFISDNQARVLAILRRTLSSVFERVTMVPGAPVHFIAGNSSSCGRGLLDTLDERGIENLFINEHYLPSRLTPDRYRILDESVDNAEGEEINSDLNPVLPFHEIVLHSSMSGGRLPYILRYFGDLPYFAFPLSFAVIMITVLSLRRRKTKIRSAVFVTGFSSMVLQVTIMLAYQVSAGILYSGLVLLSALFMAGAGAGASCGRIRPGLPAHHASYIVVSVAAGLTLLYLPGKVFFILSFLNGVLTGSYYGGAVNREYPGSHESHPSVLYALDLLGASAGGLAAGTLLLPLCGAGWSVAMLISIHTAAAISVRAGRTRPVT